MLLNSHTTDDAIIKFTAQHGKQLENLVLPSCSKVTDVGLMKAAANCPRLLHVHLDGRGSISDNAVLAFATHCPKIKSFSLQFGFSNITDAAMFALADHCTGLRRLVLHGCSSLTSKGFEAITTQCAQLQLLNISHAAWFDDSAVQTLLQRVGTLRSLALAFCSISSNAVHQIATQCDLTHLEIRGCTEVAATAMERAAIMMPHLALIDLDGSSWFKFVPKTVATPVLLAQEHQTSKSKKSARKKKKGKGKNEDASSRRQRLRQQLVGVYKRHQRKRQIAMAVIRPVLSPILGL